MFHNANKPPGPRHKPYNQTIIYIQIILTVATIISLLARLAFIANKTNLIIGMGIKTYRAITTITNTAIGIFVIVNVLLFILREIERKKQEEPKTNRSERPNAVLSTDKKMNADRIQQMLVQALDQHTHRVPQEIYNRISDCANLMNDMDKYQKKLSNLLDNNGADGFSDTEEMLDQVEQCICKNVRKVVNYISVADCGNQEDIETISSKLNTCIEDSRKQLQQVKDFLFAMAEFLNRQGEDDNTSEKLEIYKDLILKSVNEEDSL